MLDRIPTAVRRKSVDRPVLPGPAHGQVLTPEAALVALAQAQQVQALQALSLAQAGVPGGAEALAVLQAALLTHQLGLLGQPAALQGALYSLYIKS